MHESVILQATTSGDVCIYLGFLVWSRVERSEKDRELVYVKASNEGAGSRFQSAKVTQSKKKQSSKRNVKFDLSKNRYQNPDFRRFFVLDLFH